MAEENLKGILEPSLVKNDILGTKLAAIVNIRVLESSFE